MVAFIVIFIIVSALLLIMLVGISGESTTKRQSRHPQREQYRKSETDTFQPASYTIPSDKVRINIEDFRSKYCKGKVVPENLFVQLMMESLSGKEFTLIDKSTLELVEKRYCKHIADEENLKYLYDLGNTASKYEKDGKLENAIEYYSKAVKHGKKHCKINNYFHNYERLMIVYRKLKQYEDEVQVIEDAIKALSNAGKKYEHTGDMSKLQARLQKAKQLKEKVK